MANHLCVCVEFLCQYFHQAMVWFIGVSCWWLSLSQENVQWRGLITHCLHIYLALRIRVCHKKGVPPSILLWGMRLIFLMVINPIVRFKYPILRFVYPIQRVPYWMWDDHSPYSDFDPGTYTKNHIQLASLVEKVWETHSNFQKKCPPSNKQQTVGLYGLLHWGKRGGEITYVIDKCEVWASLLAFGKGP